MTTLPEQFKDSLENSVAKAITPYLENMLYGINTMNESIKKIQIPNVGKNDGDVVDNLF